VGTNFEGEEPVSDQFIESVTRFRSRYGVHTIRCLGHQSLTVAPHTYCAIGPRRWGASTCTGCTTTAG
jgi:hypothetical protein